MIRHSLWKNGFAVFRGNTFSFGVVVLVLLVIMVFTGSGAFAGEGGGNHYTGGNEDFMSGAAPPPGLYYINYFNYYSANTLRDNNGNKIPNDFKLDAVANVSRIVHSTKINVMGGNWVWHAIVPVANMHVSVAGNGQSKTGLGDVVAGSVIAWHTKNFHWLAGLDIVAPTGAYDANDMTNIGRNYWSINPVVAITYLSDGGWEASGKFMYFFNTVNNATDYRSGEEFSVDYLLGKHIGNFKLGVNGHYLIQTTNDVRKNPPAGFDGNKGTVLSVGPALQYNYKNMFFNVKYLFDTTVKNRPEGQSLWVKFMYAF